MRPTHKRRKQKYIFTPSKETYKIYSHVCTEVCRSATVRVFHILNAD